MQNEAREDFSIVLGEDEYLVLGDNRYSSHDSRDADIGTLPKSALWAACAPSCFPFPARAAFSGAASDKGESSDMKKKEAEQNAVAAEEQKELTAEEQQAARKAKFLKEIREWVVALVVALMVVLFIRTFLFTIIRVDGHSMDYTLADGERMFVTILDKKLFGVERDDVVICHFPGRGRTYFVKRVRGVPGDVIERKDGVTYINGEA